MAHFEDLTPYTYLNGRKEPPGTVNIGWLEPGYPFSTGTTSEEFRIKLEQLCHRRVNQTRGFHMCEFCPAGESRLANLGSSFETRVEGGGTVYAAPSLVHHYVVAGPRIPASRRFHRRRAGLERDRAASEQWRTLGQSVRTRDQILRASLPGDVVHDSRILVCNRLG